MVIETQELSEQIFKININYYITHTIFEIDEFFSDLLNNFNYPRHLY